MSDDAVRAHQCVPAPSGHSLHPTGFHLLWDLESEGYVVIGERVDYPAVPVSVVRQFEQLHLLATASHSPPPFLSIA